MRKKDLFGEDAYKCDICKKEISNPGKNAVGILIRNGEYSFVGYKKSNSILCKKCIVGVVRHMAKKMGII